MFINASDQRYTFVVPVMNSVHWNRHIKSVRAPAQWNTSSIYSGKYVQEITEQTLQQTTLKQHSYIWHTDKAIYKPNDSNSYPKSKSNVRACVQLQLTDTRAGTKNLYTQSCNQTFQFNTRGTASCASLFKSPYDIRLTHKTVDIPLFISWN